MGRTTITVDTKQIDRLAAELKGFEKEVAEATYHALNRTVDHVVTQVGRIIPQAYAIKQKEVKDSLKKNKPGKTSLEASVASSGHTLSFAHFPFTPKTAKRSKRSAFDTAVMVTIKKPKGKIISRKGFVASTGAKGEEKTQFNVFRRLGKSRLPIAPIRTLSIPQMITNEKVAEQVQQSAQEKLEERIDHEITRIMTSMEKEIRRK